MDLFGEGTSLEGIQTMGIVNSLKTGNVILDLVFAMLVPIIIGFALNFVSKLQRSFQNINWSNIFGLQKEYHERSIQFSTLTSSYRTTDLGSGDAQNELLIKAIQLYLDYNGILKLQAAKLELQQIGEDESMKNNSYYYRYDYDGRKTNTLADTLSNYRVVKKPLHNVWLDIGRYGKDDDMHNVLFMVQESMEDIKNSESVHQKRDLTLYFRSEGQHSIDIFIEHAYTWYLGQLRSLEDNSRYLYELKTSAGKDDENDNSDGRCYKRYKLSEEKTFESLFFKEKDSLLKIMDNFINRKGKYAIKGYPHKLGLLLHGPPGTGKTSLIKALAQFTCRSIVNVPLARITSNAELASLFYDHNFMIEGERVPVNLNFDNIIYVMEDVDALSKVVRRRDGKTLQNIASSPVFHDLNTTRNMWSMILSSNNEDCQGLVSLLMEKSERLRDAACDPSNLCFAARKLTSISGLRLVGEDAENSAATKIASAAMKCAQKQMEHQEVVDEYLGMYAKSLVNMLEHDIQITEEFENHLLGLSSDDTCFSDSYASLQSSSLSSLQLSEVEDYIPHSPHMSIGCIKDEHTEHHHETGAKSDYKTKLMDNGYEFPSGGDNEKSLFGMGPSMSLWKSKRDELNLSGILNVLDGVVDTPGRIVVMTTNHPEILDPALIRPGRIDKILLLGYLECGDLIQMLEHYFQVELEECLLSKLQEVFNGPYALKLTPAQVEQMACEYDEIEGIVQAIVNMKTRNGKE
jgi:chaperone BCS1